MDMRLVCVLLFFLSFTTVLLGPKVQQLTLHLDHVDYQIGQRVTATIMDMSTGMPFSNDQVKVAWTNSGGGTIRTDTGLTGASGELQFTLLLESSYPSGVYKVQATAANASATAYFSVLPAKEWMLTIITYGSSVPVWINGQLEAYKTNVTFSLPLGNYSIAVPQQDGSNSFQGWNGATNGNATMKLNLDRDVTVAGRYSTGASGFDSGLLLLLRGAVSMFAIALIVVWLRREGYI